MTDKDQHPNKTCLIGLTNQSTKPKTTLCYISNELEPCKGSEMPLLRYSLLPLPHAGPLDRSSCHPVGSQIGIQSHDSFHDGVGPCGAFSIPWSHSDTNKHLAVAQMTVTNGLNHKAGLKKVLHRALIK